MKKCFYKTFQKYYQILMNRMAVFSFDDESETGFH